MSGSKEEKVLALEALSQIREAFATHTEQIARYLAGNIVNSVLESGTYSLDGNGVNVTPGVIQRSWDVAAGSVLIFNHSSSDVVVTPEAGVGTAPDRGLGVHLVKAGHWKGVTLASHAMTIYGTPAAGLVGMIVFTNTDGLKGAGAL